ncbi:serine/threonine-protein kinase [Saccharopolyspora sp. MS10]|uniref:serine/threonine-protein kinase n=1 Tax=Saccharopolyspora sp. MS10 TaxID=3385973 RepID=UPI0039A0C014
MTAAPASSYYGEDGDWGEPGPVLDPGARLAPGYRVLSLLRRGNRLDVYDLWSEERGCRCVGKTLRPERAADTTAAGRLRGEGMLLTSLTHPHLVRGYDTVLSDDPARPVVITETLPGATLGYLVEQHERLEPVDAAILGAQLCSALGYLHRQGWAHLDVKPSNVVCAGGRAVLLDLSLACRIGERSTAGTFDYLAPEQARGGEMTAATDTWGLGVTLYEALSGQPPWAEVSHRRDEHGERRYPQLTERPAPLRTRRGLPARLARTVDACLTPDPASRPGVQEVADRLIAWSGVDPTA